jgi:hypothetical protein
LFGVVDVARRRPVRVRIDRAGVICIALSHTCLYKNINKNKYLRFTPAP